MAQRQGVDLYLTDMIQPYEPLSRLIFNMIEMGDASAVLSIVSVAEVMQGPIKKRASPECSGG